MRTINVTGVGSITANPDIAKIHIQIDEEDPDASKAIAKNSNSSSKLLEELEGIGVKREQIQTSRYNIFNREKYKSKHVWNASNTLSITSKEESIGQIIGICGKYGRTSGLSFAHSQYKELMSQAKVNAVKDAILQANIYCNAANVGLGSIIEINNEMNDNYQPQNMFFGEGAPPQPDVVPGNSMIQTKVRIIFEIQ